ncbi:hypothetical protein BDEG_25711 [Batrachochytrium dendrobatidis JEL423]|uniref:1-phosphatidylinositol-3-phosphate 5-kinase n=1 Tax=Batrachochytrium dendrobatidis (strain JEL423) TaxID=403673 RepID=A0A177WQX6_BATDL|nr:hypothetical protein BDEG_25711 [Batrachochytrium dendrobatidis JEL423]
MLDQSGTPLEVRTSADVNQTITPLASTPPSQAFESFDLDGIRSPTAAMPKSVSFLSNLFRRKTGSVRRDPSVSDTGTISNSQNLNTTMPLFTKPTLLSPQQPSDWSISPDLQSSQVSSDTSSVHQMTDADTASDTISIAYNPTMVRSRSISATSIASGISGVGNNITLASGGASNSSASRSQHTDGRIHSPIKLINRLRNLGASTMSKDYWMRDEKVRECYDCKQPFSTFKRKHHCRICGQIFCRKCASSIVPGARFGHVGEMRVCNFCLKIMEDYRQNGPPQVDPATLSIGSNSSSHATFYSQHHLALGPRSPSYSSLQPNTSQSTSLPHRSSSSGAMPDSDGCSQAISCAGSTTTMSIPTSNLGNTVTMFGSLSNNVGFYNGTSTDVAKKSSNPFIFKKTDEFKTSSEEIFARAPFSSILGIPAEGDALARNGQLADDPQDDTNLPCITDDEMDGIGYMSQIWTSSIFRDSASLVTGNTATQSLTDLDNHNIKPFQHQRGSEPWKHLHASNGQRQSYAGPFSGNWNPPLLLETNSAVCLQSLSPLDSAIISGTEVPPNPRLDSTETSNDSESKFNQNSPASRLPMRSAVPSIYGRAGLNAVSVQHMRGILAQTLVEAAVCDPDAWIDVLMGMLIKATGALRPNLRHGDNIDIRNYIKIKKIPGGTISDSALIHGVVSTKQAIHKSMMRMISAPRILLITFPLEYQRIENQFISLETLVAQEEDHIKHLISRVTALDPNVVLVQKTVSRIALEMLLKANIAVVHNVKPSVLFNVSRCTQADIIHSIDKLALSPKLGTCETFSFKAFVNADIIGMRKTFMYFEGCNVEAGCSFVLRGDSVDQLTRVKRVLDLMIFVAYSLRLETSLLRDMYALTPNLPQSIGTSVLTITGATVTPPKPSTGVVSNSIVVSPNASGATLTCSVNHSPALPLSTSSSSTPLLAQSAVQKAEDSPAERAFKIFQNTILSGSPSVKFPAPYLLVKMKEASTRRNNTGNTINTMANRRTPARFPSIKMKQTASDFNSAANTSTTLSQSAAPYQLDRPLSFHMRDFHVDDALVAAIGDTASSDRTSLDAILAPSQIDPDSKQLTVVPSFLDPRSILSHVNGLSIFSQQNITILYSNICRGNTIPCIPAHQSLIQYYGDTDLTLGQYLENLCLESCFVCPIKGCENTLMAHSRIYVHGNYRLIVNVDSLPCPVRGMEDHIIMWSFCKICHVSTPFVPMSEESWKYSFGKYLELHFYLPKLNCRAISCTHDIHRNHITYFSLHNLTVRFEMESIILFEVSVPPMRRLAKTEHSIKLRQQDLEALRHQIESYYDSILQRIKLFTIDIVPITKQQACKESILELGKRATSEQKLLLQLLQQTSITSAADDHLALNAVFFMLLSKVTAWDSEFTMFVRTFLQPEQGDVRRMAGQIKRIFVDRDALLGEFRIVIPTGIAAPAIPSTNASNHIAPQFDLDLDMGNMPALSWKLPVLCSSPMPKMVEVLEADRMDEDCISVHDDSSVALGMNTTASIPASLSVQLSQLGQSRMAPPLPIYASQAASVQGESSFVFIDRRLSFAWMKTTLFLLDNPNAHINAPVLGSSPSDHAPDEMAVAKTDTITTSPNMFDDPEDYTVSDTAAGKPVRWIHNSNNNSSSPEPDILHRTISATSVTSRGSHASTNFMAGAISNAEIVVKSIGGGSRIGSEREDDVPLHEQIDDGVMFPRHLSLKPRSRVTQLAGVDTELPIRSKRLSKGQVLADEDEPLAGVNMITGVAAEVEPIISMPQFGPANERASILKSITNIWNGNPANFLPIAYPSNPTEHIFPDSLIIVREDEPTSILAFTLGSRHYKEKLVSMQPGTNTDSIAASQAPAAAVVAEDMQQSRYSIDFDDQFGDIEETLLRGTGTHIRYQFWDGPTRMHCKVFFAEQFDALRRNCGADEQYVQSLARCIKWEASGGKSGSTFLKTRDDWLVAKQLSRPEMDALYKFAPEYFEYMSRAFFHELPTVLAKIFGFYRIGFKNPVTGKTIKMDLLVMENLFYDRSISRIFDLKGSMRNRHVQSTGKQNEVLMDENLVEFIYDSPLFIREHSKRLLRASVWNDTLFLSKLNVMDYSLLVGIDSDSNELVVGIVDFIRTFTWDKKLESWVKETGFLGGGGKEPTIVTPRQYKNRFREAMEKYFLMVPDKFLIADAEGSLLGSK